MDVAKHATKTFINQFQKLLHFSFITGVSYSQESHHIHIQSPVLTLLNPVQRMGANWDPPIRYKVKKTQNVTGKQAVFVLQLLFSRLCACLVLSGRLVSIDFNSPGFVIKQFYRTG